MDNDRSVSSLATHIDPDAPDPIGGTAGRPGIILATRPESGLGANFGKAARRCLPAGSMPDQPLENAGKAQRIERSLEARWHASEQNCVEILLNI